MKYHQYYLVGRKSPKTEDESPPVYRMKMWATDHVRAESKFWYYMARLQKVKRSNGQLIHCTEIFEKKPTQTANYGVWIRYQSRTDYINMYKEFRDVSLNGAIEQMYDEMGSR